MINKKDECEMVKDYAIQFLEHSLHNKSEEFVNNHLLTCDDCRKYYNSIKSQFQIDKVTEKDNIMINH